MYSDGDNDNDSDKAEDDCYGSKPEINFGWNVENKNKGDQAPIIGIGTGIGIVIVIENCYLLNGGIVH